MRLHIREDAVCVVMETGNVRHLWSLSAESIWLRGAARSSKVRADTEPSRVASIQMLNRHRGSMDPLQTRLTPLIPAPRRLIQEICHTFRLAWDTQQVPHYPGHELRLLNKKTFLHF